MSNIVVMCRKYSDDMAIDDVIDYCYKKCISWFGYGVRIGTIEDVKRSFLYMKEYHGQLEGRQLLHIVINVDTFFDTGIEYSNYTKEEDLKNLSKFVSIISKLIFYEGFQNCYFIHRGKKNPHAHFIINSVNCKDGSKLRNAMDLGHGIFDYLNEKYHDLKWQRVYYNKVTVDKYGYQR